MKHWLETRQVLDRLADLAASNMQAALATVVRVRGSAYRHEGANMVAADGSTVGNVSGGCLEGDVREVALQVIASGAPKLRRYCSSSDEITAWDLGLGCDGEITVWIEPVHSPRTSQRLLLEHDAPFAICTLIDESARPADRTLTITASGWDGTLGDRGLDRALVEEVRPSLGEYASGIVECAGRTMFVDYFVPPPTLVVVGAGDDARPLVRLGAEVGFRVFVIDRRPALLSEARFPDASALMNCAPADFAALPMLHHNAYAVVMMHRYEDDAEYLRVLLERPVPYIGVLGPRQRTDRMVQRLGAFAAVNEERIHGPVGLDIGTDGAEQVALAVIAEILSVRSGRAATSLRERTAPIHAGE